MKRQYDTVTIEEMWIRRADSQIIRDHKSDTRILLVAAAQGIMVGDGHLDTSPHFKRFIRHQPQGDDLLILGTHDDKLTRTQIELLDRAQQEAPAFVKWIKRNFKGDQPEPEPVMPADVFTDPGEGDPF